MNTRKLTQIMLIILGVLVLLIVIKAIENSNKKIELEDNKEVSASNNEYEEEPEAPTQGAEYDPNAMAFKGFEYLYSAFNSLQEGGECKLAIQQALIEYGTVVRMWTVENASAADNVLTFNIVSDEEISDETYKITVSESGTIIERTDK